MSRKLLFCLLASGLFMAASAAFCQGWDFEGVDDFSIYNGNPNGPWSYGSTPNLNSGYAITLMDRTYDTNPVNPGTDCSYWYHSFNGGGSGYVVCNKSNYDQFGCHRAKSMSVNPVDGQYTVRRLTLPPSAPTGKYYVYSFWQELWGDGSFPGDGSAILLVNGQTEHTAYIPAGDTSIREYEQFLTLKSGDTIDFTNGCGTHGFSTGDWLQVQCRVAYVISWIEGTVRESSGGTPVKGVVITASNAGQPDTHTRTDYRGRYLLPVYAGSHAVTATYFNDGLTPKAFSGVTTTTGQGTIFDISLDPSDYPNSWIEGTVTASASGSALGGVTVTATNQGQPDTQTQTDTQGRYSLTVYSGTHTVTVSSVAGLEPKIVGGVTTAFSQTTTLNIALDIGGTSPVELKPAPNQSEMDVAAAWVAGHFARATAGQAPFSFVYNGQQSDGLLPGWTYAETTEQLDNERTRRTQIYTDPATWLQMRVVMVQYNDFPTVEWTIYFRNLGAQNTPILENIQALDIELQREAGEGEFLLNYNQGSLCQADDFRPFITVLGPGKS